MSGDPTVTDPKIIPVVRVPTMIGNAGPVQYIYAGVVAWSEEFEERLRTIVREELDAFNKREQEKLREELRALAEAVRGEDADARGLGPRA